MAWTFIWLMLQFIPIGGMLWIVWWAIHKTDEQPTVSSDEDGGSKTRVHSNPHPRAPRPHAPRTTRRGPHGGRSNRSADTPKKRVPSQRALSSGMVVIDGLSDCEAAEKVEGALRLLPEIEYRGSAAGRAGRQQTPRAASDPSRHDAHTACSSHIGGLCRTVFSARASAE
jgi:hypothetical protein